MNDYKITEIWPVSTKICPDGGIGINWTGPIGFGECIIYWENDKLHADTEYLCSNEDKRFLKTILNELINHIIIDE